MKKVISFAVIVLIILSTMYIYTTFKEDEIYYLALGDSLAVGTNSFGEEAYGYTDYVKDYLVENNKLEKFVKKYAKNGYKVNDLINDINNNKEITMNNKKITIKSALVESDLITLSIGSNDVIQAYQYKENIDDEINNTLERMEELFQILREYNKEKIIVTGYYNPFHYNISWNLKVKNANKKLDKIAKSYGIIYVDVFELFQSNTYLPNPLDPHPSKEGYKKISELVIEKIQEEV